MTYFTSFIMFGTRYEFMLNTETLARNYDDEPYAYDLQERGGKWFEINLLKNGDGGPFTGDGSQQRPYGG